MKSRLVKANSLPAHGLPALTTRERVDMVRYEKPFGDFVKAAWHHAGEPQNFQSNWHIDCVTDHLMAVARREIKGPGPLIFTMPPRHMKSRGVNVFFPAWTWAQNPDPDNQKHGLAVLPGTMMGPAAKLTHVEVTQARNLDVEFLAVRQHRTDLHPRYGSQAGRRWGWGEAALP